MEDKEKKLKCPFCKKWISELRTYVNNPARIYLNPVFAKGWGIEEEPDVGDYGSVYCPECGENITEGDVEGALEKCGFKKKKAKIGDEV